MGRGNPQVFSRVDGGSMTAEVWCTAAVSRFSSPIVALAVMFSRPSRVYPEGVRLGQQGRSVSVEKRNGYADYSTSDRYVVR